MSGGAFDYRQDHIAGLADNIEYYFDEYGENYTRNVHKEVNRCIELLRQAYAYVQRIDWLIMGDDGEASFHQRLKEDLEKLEKSKEHKEW